MYRLYSGHLRKRDCQYHRRRRDGRYAYIRGFQAQSVAAKEGRRRRNVCVRISVGGFNIDVLHLLTKSYSLTIIGIVRVVVFSDNSSTANPTCESTTFPLEQRKC